MVVTTRLFLATIATCLLLVAGGCRNNRHTVFSVTAEATVYERAPFYDAGASAHVAYKFESMPHSASDNSAKWLEGPGAVLLRSAHCYARYMKKLLPLLAVLALAGCNGQASVVETITTEEMVFDQQLPDPAMTEEKEMLACRVDGSAPCARIGVMTDGSVVILMRNESGWMTVADSECMDDTCYAKDENGAEWTLEP